ncbi:MAG: RtcB family protein [Zetaproteobacteria bacterium]|nr:MAG: RtcB family protein [Zetaproteobacteria bacterium]
MKTSLRGLLPIGDCAWQLPRTGAMRVPGVLYASAELVQAMDTKVFEQMANVATLPGIVRASYAMPDAHWGYGFPIGGVAAFDAEAGVISAGGVGFDISCGVRLLHTGMPTSELENLRDRLADLLQARIPAGVGSCGRIRLSPREMDAMLKGGARWAVERGWGEQEDLEHIEERGCMAGADPAAVSDRAKQRQRDEMGTLGSGNHYLEIQRVQRIFDETTAARFGLAQDEIVISIHCGSRGLGHQIGTDYLRRMALEAGRHGLQLPDRELACAPIRSATGQAYLGAMRAGINCALANRQMLTHLVREVFAVLWPSVSVRVIYDVSHNTCKLEQHEIEGEQRLLFVHRKGATRALPPGHASLPKAYRDTGQPVLIGGTMGTASHVLVGCESSVERAFASACHGAGRAMSRHAARKRWRGGEVRDGLAGRGIVVRSPSLRGIAEEAPEAYKDVDAVVEAAERAGLARRVARLVPLICIKG